jgi:peroxiredoxin
MKLDRIIESGIAVLMCVFVGTLYLQLHDNVVKAGDRAPDFSIKADNGQTITARDFGGKLLVLNFWATWCPPCISEVPSLGKLQQALGSQGVVVFGVSEDQDPEAYKNFLAKYQVPFLTVRDPTKAIKEKYGTQQIPETYLINRDGKVVEKVVSDADWSSERMIEHVKSLL